MARSGSPSQVGGKPAGDAAGTRAALVESAIATLKSEGFAGASARAIARNAGCNQALVFYHFGTVVNLLLAALDETSGRRRQRYESEVTGAGGIEDLLRVATAIYREDLDEGHISVLAEMIAGASSTPGLGHEVSARIAPWIDFAEESVAATLASTGLAALLPPKDVAFAIVAMYLGIEMLAHLDDDRSRAESLFDTARSLTSVLAAVLPAAPPAPRGSATPAPAARKPAAGHSQAPHTRRSVT